jgi:hypothetical protein
MSSGWGSTPRRTDRLLVGRNVTQTQTEDGQCRVVVITVRKVYKIMIINGDLPCEIRTAGLSKKQWNCKYCEVSVVQPLCYSKLCSLPMSNSRKIILKHSDHMNGLMTATALRETPQSFGQRVVGTDRHKGDMGEIRSLRPDTVVGP